MYQAASFDNEVKPPFSLLYPLNLNLSTLHQSRLYSTSFYNFQNLKSEEGIVVNGEALKYI